MNVTKAGGLVTVRCPKCGDRSLVHPDWGSLNRWKMGGTCDACDYKSPSLNDFIPGRIRPDFLIETWVRTKPSKRDIAKRKRAERMEQT